jgi:hypothetical protein
LRVRKRIEETAIPIDELDQPHFRWVQPGNHEPQTGG